MSVSLFQTTTTRLYRDRTTRLVTGTVFGTSGIVYALFGTVAGLTIPFVFIAGLVLATISLNNKARISLWIKTGRDYFGYSDCLSPSHQECSACGVVQCQRKHVEETAATTTLWLDEELDKAVGDFYSAILRNFISSWFQSLSDDEAFLHLVKQSLRDATCRLGVALKSLDMPRLITERLLPVLFSHSEIVNKMVQEGVTMAQFGSSFLLKEHPLHPAVRNRQSEIRYLRTMAQRLIPKLITTQHYNSQVFHSLLRELIACWVLLPLLDVIADPNLLNALIIAATDPPVKRFYKEGAKVAFLDSFVQAKMEGVDVVLTSPVSDEDDLLKDQTKLYSFMQFLKREGAVDLLRFHLDVDHLNSELQDPRVTTDPAKLSALQQQSEKLLAHYQQMVRKIVGGELTETEELNEAHEMVKGALYGKWKRTFFQTPEYFKLVYGENSIPDGQRKKRSLEQINSNSGTKTSKSKGSTVEATEAQQGWDAFSETQLQQNATIYSSVAQKLRKERGQNLDQFMATFMVSIEQSTDVGEDVIQMNQQRNGAKDTQHTPPGANLVFGDLFELRKAPNGKEALNYHLHPVRGPSKCLIYMASKILRFPSLLIHFMISLVNISVQTVDCVIRSLLQRLLNAGLYEPRLAVLINLLRDQLFGAHSEKSHEPTPNELLDRQKLARQRLVGVAPKGNLGVLADTLQSPPMNKHLIYSLFDIIVDELYPEAEAVSASEGQ